MTTVLPEPVVATAGSTDPVAPLVILVHGQGSNERDIIDLASHLPQRAGYAAVRAPIAEGPGFAWFASRDIGRPVSESLRQSMVWFTRWLDSYAPEGRDVIVVGFGSGAAFAGGLLLDRPSRYSGAAILYGALPFDADVPVAAGRLAGIPVFLAQDEQDTTIPRELLDATWDYVTNPSGSPAWATRYPGGRGISKSSLTDLAGWLHARLAYLDGHGPGSRLDVPWPGLPGGVLPERDGPRPQVSTNTPQEQLTQNSPPALQEELFARLAALPGVATGPSAISVPGARAFTLARRSGPQDAFLVSQIGEFAHLHPSYDGSLHLALPPAMAADVVTNGWGVAHPLAGLQGTPGLVMLFGPRTRPELEVISAIVSFSHNWAESGALGDAGQVV